MLQQTQVLTVIPYFRNFMARFADVRALADASEDEVLGAWSGLGYYSRARNLHRAAREIAAQGWPDTVEGLQALPGIGRSTAAAIASFCFGRRAAILDGNVRRVFARLFGVGASDAAGIAQLWAHADRAIASEALADDEVPTYIQGLMDLGATVCTRRRPACSRCPLSNRCVALEEDSIDRHPAPRKSRIVPMRTYRMLLIRQGSGFLLQRRPAQGLWGGLWCLPVLSIDDQPPIDQAWAAATASLSPGLIQPESSARPGAPIARFEHVFTHFRMLAEICVCRIAIAPLAGEDGSWVSIDPADVRAFADAPLPGPIRTLLATIAADRAGRD